MQKAELSNTDDCIRNTQMCRPYSTITSALCASDLHSKVTQSMSSSSSQHSLDSHVPCASISFKGVKGARNRLTPQRPSKTLNTAANNARLLHDRCYYMIGYLKGQIVNANLIGHVNWTKSLSDLK